MASTALKERIKAVLHGDMMTKYPSNAKIVRIFTSSTFTDTKNERNALMTNVYPQLKAFCQSKGYEFQVVDMRWGVRDESTADHMTTALCMQEIKACQKISTGPNFVTFLGQKYGYRPFPAKILAAEFDLMLDSISEENNKDLLARWFLRDDNSIPSEYVLQPITVHLPHFNDNSDEDKRREARKAWWEQFDAIQVILRQAASKTLGTRDAAKYFISVTEDEIHNGMLNANAPNKHCIWFRRNIEDLLDVANNCKNTARFYTDFVGDVIDPDAAKLLQELKENRIEQTLDAERIVSYDVKWVAEKGIDPKSCPEHKKYIEQLCSDFRKKLTENILEGIEESKSADIEDPLYHEIVQHIKICQEKCKKFHGRNVELDAIKGYLNTESNQFPLVLYGQSGSGKTSLVAMAARQCKEDTGSAVVIRFLGTTQQSCNIKTVLVSLSQQICGIYGGDLNSIPEDYNKLIKFFADLLKNTTSTKPLFIFLDSLDNLSDDYGARQLPWLPLTLPRHVKLVVSTLPDAIYQCFPILKIAIPNEKSFIEVPQLPTTEATKILETWLEHGARKMTNSQKRYVIDTLAKCSLPLFVKLTFDEVFQWKSYSSENECVLQATVRAAIVGVFEKLEYRHGQLLVSHALSYITRSKNGASDAEMEDLLSLDDEVLNDIYQYWTPPSRRLPPLLWIRIKTELGCYIVSRGADGVRVNTWYHRQFIEAARERYLANDEHNKKISKSLSEYFLGTWSSHDKPYLDKSGKNLQADRLVPKQPLVFTSKENRENILFNLRKFSELPYALIGAKMLDCLKENVLCNYDWLFTKLRATSFPDVVNDFHAASETFPDDDEISLILQTLQLSTTALIQDPAQLASQLVGRLLDKIKRPENEGLTNVRRLVFEQAHRPGQPALVPDKVCLEQPGGPIQHTITAHTSFSNVYLTHDQKKIISASYDGTLKIFDARFGYVIRSTEGVVKMTHFLVDVTEDYGVVSGSRLIQVWNINTGQKLHEFPACSNTTIGLINDDVVAIIDTKLVVNNFRTGKQVGFFTDTRLRSVEVNNRMSNECCLACPPHGNLVAYSRVNENTVNILNYKTYEIIHVVTVDELNSVDAMTASTNGLIYVAGHNRGPILSFELTTGHGKHPIAGGQCVESPNSLQTTPNSRYLAINMDQHFAVWDLVNDEVLYNIPHPNALKAIFLGSCGRLLVTAGYDYLLRLYDLHRIRNEDRDSAQSLCPTFEFVATSPFMEKPNTRYIVLQNVSGTVNVWDNETGEKVKEIRGSIGPALMLDDHRALINSGGHVKILDLPSATVTQAIRGICDDINMRGLLEKNHVLVVSDGRRHLKIMNLTTGELVKALKKDLVGGLIERLFVSRNGSTAVTFNDCGAAVVWNISTNDCKVIQGVAVSKRARLYDIDDQCADISDDGRHLAHIDGTGEREVVQVYDLSKACLKFSLPTTEEEIHCVSIATATRRVLTGSSIHCLSIWDLDKGLLVCHFSGCKYRIQSFTLSRDRTRVMTSPRMATGSQSMRIYDLLKAQFLAAFTPEEMVTSTFNATTYDVAVCKPDVPGIINFRLLSTDDPEAEETERTEKIDWGETKVFVNDPTRYVHDGDDNRKEDSKED